jgi:hypothetical protein
MYRTGENAQVRVVCLSRNFRAAVSSAVHCLENDPNEMYVQRVMNIKSKSKSRLLLHVWYAAISCFIHNFEQQAGETTYFVLIKDLLNLRKAV